jgi:hypothetical protein
MIGRTGVIRVGSRVCVRDTDDRFEFDIVGAARSGHR